MARALAQDALLLVMDEPTASLDLGNRLLVLERVRATREHGYGVVFSTYDPDQAHELATTVAVIAGGRPCGLGAAGEVSDGRDAVVRLARCCLRSSAHAERSRRGRQLIATTESFFVVRRGCQEVMISEGDGGGGRVTPAARLPRCCRLPPDASLERRAPSEPDLIKTRKLSGLQRQRCSCLK